MYSNKIVIYQVFTRLFGNVCSRNKPWGSIEENGVGKFNDFTDKALKEIKNLGVSHIWYCGVLHHAMVADYTAIGISNDHPAVVKGRAGSPYAIKDYYNVDPDLAVNPAERLNEFKELINRTHQAGLKLIIDIVPNHVARKYEGQNNPPGVKDLGANDIKSLTYSRNNNFYYNPGEVFEIPDWLDGYLPLGGEYHLFKDVRYHEFPAKWTGNNSRLSKPHFYDWYETAKLNYGVRPDGNKDFDELPDYFDNKDIYEHYNFWAGKELPDTWLKMRDIALYWLEMGVDGFRYDMAEMVPVEFWSFLNSGIKIYKPDAMLLAEVYNPSAYRDYIFKGKMDYLYDKVELYDTLKAIIQGNSNTDFIAGIMHNLSDIGHHMLHFLENHDEQRIANNNFAGNPHKGKPAMLISACISTSPTMVYFGQEVGEPALENAGFGSASRTSIFDYIGVPHHQRWMNNKKFDGALLSSDEKELRDFYCRLLNFTLNSNALTGNYREIHAHNRANTPYYNNHVFSFVRFNNNENLIIICNFHETDTFGFDLEIPADIIGLWALNDGNYHFIDQLYFKEKTILNVKNRLGKMRISIGPLESFIFKAD